MKCVCHGCSGSGFVEYESESFVCPVCEPESSLVPSYEGVDEQ